MYESTDTLFNIRLIQIFKRIIVKISNKPPFSLQMIAILDTSTVPATLRPYIMLLLDLIFESPIQRGNSIIPYEEVVRELSADTIYRDSQIGLGLSSGKFSCGPYCTNAVVVIKVSNVN